MASLKIFEQAVTPRVAENEICLKLPVARRSNWKPRFVGNNPPEPVISRQQAVFWLADRQRRGESIRTVCLEGPGDVLAEPELLLACLDELAVRFPDQLRAITTLGLGVDRWADELVGRGVSRVNLLVDTVTAEIARKIYAWIRPGRRTVALPEAVQMLLEHQLLAIKCLRQRDVTVHVRTTVYPGVNDSHIDVLARVMASNKVTSISLHPFIAGPETGSDDQVSGMINSCTAEELLAARTTAAKYLQVVEESLETIIPSESCFEGKNVLPTPTRERPNIAVTSSNGMDVDLHLGQATRFLIYGPRGDGVPCLLGARTTPETVQGATRWQTLARECLHDCFLVLVADAGANPKKELAGQGVKVIACEENIEGMVDVLYGGGPKKRQCTTT